MSYTTLAGAYNQNFNCADACMVSLYLLIFCPTGRGAVYTYDAIGSYERTGYSCQGSGKDLIQPVLDNQLKADSPLLVPQRVSSCSRGIPPAAKVELCFEAFFGMCTQHALCPQLTMTLDGQAVCPYLDSADLTQVTSHLHQL